MAGEIRLTTPQALPTLLTQCVISALAELIECSGPWDHGTSPVLQYIVIPQLRSAVPEYMAELQGWYCTYKPTIALAPEAVF